LPWRDPFFVCTWGCEVSIAVSVADVLEAIRNQPRDLPCGLVAPRIGTVPPETTDAVIAEGILANVAPPMALGCHVDGSVVCAPSSSDAFRALRRLHRWMETPESAARGPVRDQVWHTTALVQRQDCPIAPVPSGTPLSTQAGDSRGMQQMSGDLAWPQAHACRPRPQPRGR
jgi:hypothetical protein